MARPGDELDAGEFFRHFAPYALRHAADEDDRGLARPAALKVVAADFARGLLLRLLADAACHKHHDVGLILRRLRPSHVVHRGAQPVPVVGIHLASENSDKKFTQMRLLLRFIYS